MHAIHRHKDAKKEVKPGDLIKISCGDGKHWAVYVGGRNVVHLGPASEFPGLGAGKGVVLKEKLKDVVKKDKWKVNNFLDNEYKPRPAVVIVEKACSLVDTEKQYDLSKYNSQNFATEMRYGKPECRQVR
ncbi:phospholipase A and acyltransferase 3-like [Cololabis saira]|uniref:phospholipase A and acyltransferase 3-like n=1 Tax=Cololabis saira TaxID=129043 RepID=UPI002AD593FF|nr:phospholipase A and acyltransferase 3-like [Cololabis saira]